MAPQRFASVRRARGAPTTPRLAPFRDDTGLVALRYEQTKQAEPPIPLPPPRNPRRLNRPASTFTCSTAPTSPVTVSPPPVSPPIPPPQEEHPLFRTQRLSSRSRSRSRSQADEWKRDSGAPTSSSVTLREEYAEDPISQKFLGDIADTPSAYSSDEESAIDTQQAPPPPLTVSIPARPENKENTVSSPTPSTQTTPSPTRRTSLSIKLSKSFGIGPSGSRRLRKKMLGTDRAASQAAAAAAAAPPETEPVRGSPNKSPRWPKSPKLTPQPTGSGPCTSPGREQAECPLSSATDMVNSFAPITTHIPEESLWDDLGAVSFSKRGSIMFGSKSNLFKSLMMSGPEPKPTATTAKDEHATATATATVTAFHDMSTTTDNVSDNRMIDEADATPESPRAVVPQADAAHSVPSIRVSSMDVERESQKVRSLYESGDDLHWEDGGRVSLAERLEPTVEVPSEEEEENVVQARRDYERAGGIEDWADLEGAEVDRYGFISAKRPMSRAETADHKSSPFSTRRRNVLLKRPSTSYSSSLPGGFIRPPSRKVSARSLNTYTSDLSTVSRRSTRSSIRSATNRFPHNRDRRWMDEAGEMLSLQAGLTGITDDEKMGKTLEAQKRKEAERTEKWRKMATAVKTSGGSSSSSNKDEHPEPPLQTQVPQGQGMSYEFDTKSPKLIDRTWKGIPDCWRSAAWYSFLAASAKAHNNHTGNTETDDYLITEFRRLQAVASSDDVQIDLDVPRTVNGHIMFRRRYRGGQRLLFRVLHAIALYFPVTGYVQGMASLAATLLCYYDEERTFVMLVRLWRYRGLEWLYQPDFPGLMVALAEFEKRWLVGAGKDVASKLTELDISATAYGTRWYLTLFNLSIPFPAQLRVWDVFMLLGDCPPEPSPPTTTAAAAAAAEVEEDPLSEDGKKEQPPPPPKGLDILHAASAALIHALRDVLLDSDFENAMKALTAWIPVRDEDLLMKVARAEWRRHQGRGRLWEWERGREKEKKEKEKKEKEKREKEGKEKKEKEGKEKKEREGKEKKEKEGKEKREKEGKEKGKEGKEKGWGGLWERDNGNKA
ncbi:hypothetical protein C8A00DRAFT_11696 [Chaetomidium leptoderma]|uniref:Rab-GAP TBC domain-containing protein n=1 Tax=Chaetomidium leptoderma TaxID=669021 RepID=A0AAN6VWI4_9PEZI|nr:hypothetical protein C8A00DRAFT_11696 [Chaetomidium leptoderma]